MREKFKEQFNIHDASSKDENGEEGREVEVYEELGEKLDKINKELSELETDKSSEELHNKWLESFRDQPALFASEDNLKKLKEMPMHERLLMLAKTSHFLTFTPKLAEKYFDQFPDDLLAIKTIFDDCQGHPNGGLDYNLFTIAGRKLNKDNLVRSRAFYHLEQYQGTADRRDLAPSLLLNNFEYKYNDSFKEFGEGAEGFLKALDEAAELKMKGDHFIRPEQIFTPEYEQMDEEKKARFLRKAIAELHFSLLFDETFNSCFTKENIERDKKTGRGQALGFNVAHSMIYKTYQPKSAYELKSGHFERQMYSTAEMGGDIEEYPFHRLLLAVLDRMKDVRAEKDLNTDVLVDFWNKNRNPIFCNKTVEALINQDIDRAGGKLLELLRKEKIDKNSLSAALYRLEFGRIGISEEGVRYLGRIYDLEELNNPDYFVQRLTAKGDVGIFNKERTLIKHFNLGDLSEIEKVIRPRIHEFVYETLFTAKKGETEEERKKREQYLKEFKENYFGFYESEFFQKTGVRFNNLDFKEQGWFLIYYQNADEAKKKSLLDFAGKYGENGLKTFLSLEYGEEMGEKILKLGEKLDPVIADSIFAKYGETAESIEKIADYLRENLKNSQGYDEETINKISENILLRGKKLLVDFAGEIEDKKPKEIFKSKEEFARKLSKYREDITLFGATFQTLFKDIIQGGIERFNFYQISGVEIIQRDISELPDETKKEMLVISEENWRDRDGGQETVAKFKKALQRTGDSEYSIIKKDGKVIAFIRFDKTDKPGYRYAASFNVHPEYQDFSIGEAMRKTVLREMTERYILEGTGDPSDPYGIVSKYIEEDGFVITGLKPFPGKIGYRFEITCDKTEENTLGDLETRNVDKSLLIEHLSRQEETDNFIVKAYDENDIIGPISDIKELTERGYLGTRYFRDNNRKIYVFEKTTRKIKREAEETEEIKTAA